MRTALERLVNLRSAVSGTLHHRYFTAAPSGFANRLRTPRQSGPYAGHGDHQSELVEAFRIGGTSSFILLSGVMWASRSFQFRLPIPVLVSLQQDLHVYESVEYGILAYGYSESEALERFAEQFVATWDALAHEPDSRLTLDAQELRDSLQRLVR
jgi:hypothetical protein